MSFHSWLQNLRSALAPGRGQVQRRRRASHRAPTHRPNLEVLEDRCVPAFLAPMYYATDATSNAVVTADFNGDGHLDLATANHDSNSVSMLLGNGDGTLQTARIFATSGSPVWIEAGDFNGDGKLDLVTGNEVWYGDDWYNEFSTLLGNGDGSFQWIGNSSAGGGNFQDVALGDVNGDGKLDVATTMNGGFTTGGGGVVAAMGDGNGFFGAIGDWEPFGFFSSIVAADFNRDGNADLAWTNYGLYVSLVPWGIQPIAVGGGGSALAVADLNGDGNPDLVTDTTVLQGNGDGTFHVTQYYDANLMVGDFNGDGSLDLLAGNNLLPGSGNDAGTFPAKSGYWTLGDFNGDGRWDMVSVGGWAVSVRLNDGIWDVGPPPPALRINDVSVVEGNTGAVAATFTVTLSFASAEPVTVAYATADGSATPGSDYQATSGTLTFNPGETSKTITVLVNGDRLGEPNETLFVNLSGATNATLVDGHGVATIMDDEPRISISDFSKAEGKAGQATLFTFTVTLSAPYDQPVTMSYRTANWIAAAREDYVAKTGTLTFAPGETTKTITIEVKGDSRREANECFFLDLFDNSSNSLFTKKRGIGTILNDD
jgi:Calx-beta domain/FG-GAP-like repeat/FG-GAP repeat